MVDGKTQATDVKVLQRNPDVIHDTEDKKFWVKEGGKNEPVFVREIVPKLKRNIIIHPEKVRDETYIDLLDLDRNVVADLKTQTTPFFKSSYYGLDPQYAVTFNRKDYEYYRNRFPEAIIYWWVNWKQLEYSDRNGTRHFVQPLHGVWEILFENMRTIIESGQAPLHPYQRRINDSINAKDSFLFDLRTFDRIL